MNKKQQYMIINMSLYTIGIMASKVISFIMLPFNSFYLTVEQFGSYDYVLVISSLLLPLVSMALPETIYRFYRLDEDEEHRFGIYYVLIFGTAGFFSALSSWVLFLLKQDYFILIGIYIFVNVIFLFFQYVTRAKGEIKHYLGSTLLNSILQMILNIALILLTDLRIEAILISTIMASLISSVYLRFRMNLRLLFAPWKEYKDTIKELLVYSIPLVPNSLNWWVINSINKFYIKWFCGLEALGVFAMASRFPNFISSFSTVIYMSSMDTVLKDYENGNKDKSFSDALNFLIQILLPLTAFCIVVTKFFIFFFVDVKYKAALNYIPILYCSVIMSIFSSFFSIIYHCEKKTYRNLQTSIYGSIVTIILGLISVKYFDLMGAVLTMLISNFTIMYVRIKDVKRHVHLEISKKYLLSECVVLLFSIIGYYLFPLFGQVIIAIFIAIFFVFSNRSIVYEILKKQNPRR